MPDPYSNPTYTPPTGTYHWVPNFVPSGGTPAGPAYDTLKLMRGQFNNFLPAVDGLTGAYTIAYTGNRSSADSSETWPILSAFRPLADPADDRGAAPDKPFIVTGADWSWQATIDSATQLSTITLSYALTIDPNDPDLLQYIVGVDGAEADAQAIAAYQAAKQKDPTVDPALDVNWAKYPFARLEAVDATGKVAEYPAVAAGATPTAVLLTGRATTDTPTPQTITLRFGTAPTTGSYPSLTVVRLINRYQLTTLKLYLNKVMLFTAARVNMDDAQLPCKLLQYTTEINFNVDPSNPSSIWPGGLSGPNFHLKVFSPDYRESSPGFAHSIELRFLIFSLPIFDLSSMDFDTGTSSSYMTVFAGVVAGKRNLRFALLPTVDSTSPGRAVLLDAVDAIPAQAVNLRLDHGANGSVAPSTDDASWSKLAVYAPDSPPSFDPASVWPSPYLYQDIGATTNAWYRVAQEYQNGSQQIGSTFQSQLYVEHTPLQMVDTALPVTLNTAQTIVRRVPLASQMPQANPLLAAPLAIWVMEDDSPFSGDITVAQGAWTLSFRAFSDDASFLLSTQLFARLWFIPEGQAIDPADPHHWRGATEISFQQDGSGNITMARSSPTDLSQVIVSAPLPGTLTYLEMVRYISADLVIPEPFPGIRARLVMGLYVMGNRTAEGISQNSKPTDRAYPHLTLEIDSTYAALETPLYQTLSGEILPQHASRYTSASYTSLPKPLVVTRALFGGESLAGDPAAYVLYDSTFKSASTAAGDALSSLLALSAGDSLEPGKFYLPITQVATTKGTDLGAVAADFVTNGKSIGSGRIAAGHWKLTMLISRGIDTATIGCELRIEAFLVTRDGTVVERIFRSARFDGPTATGTSGQIVYETDVTIPFLVGSGETQLIIRLWAYPYSRSGDAIDLTTTQKALGTVPLGLRLDQISLDQHTVTWLNINQVASFAGSPAFYEDLPLVPNQSFTTDDFTFVVDQEISGKTSITFSDLGFNFTGTLYSTIWFVNLPQGIEAQVAMAGLNGSPNVAFRTVLADATTSGSEEGLSAVEDRMFGTVHFAYQGTDDTTADTSQSQTVVRHIRQDAVGRLAREDNSVSGQAGTATKSLVAYAPAVTMVRSEASPGVPSLVSILAQIDDSDTASFTTALSFSSGAPTAWCKPNRNDLADQNFTDIRRVAQGLKHPSIAPSTINSLSYVAGWVEPGTIIVKEVDLFNAGKGGAVAAGTLFVVDGSTDVRLSTEGTIVLPADGNLNGTAVETFPGIAWDGDGRLVVAYALQGYDGYLFARASNGGQAFGTSHIIANLRMAGVSGSSGLAITGPALCWHASTQSLHVAFWVGGKILVTRVVGGPAVGGVIASPLQLVAGSSDFTSSSGSANSALQALKSMGYLRTDRAGVDESDVPQQRVGFFASDTWPSQGNLFVYYRNSVGVLNAREVAVGGLVGEPVILRTSSN